MDGGFGYSNSVWLSVLDNKTVFANDVTIDMMFLLSSTGKSYKSGRIEERRRQHFHTNRARVQEHNEGHANGTHSYNLTLNHLADRPPHRLLHSKYS